MATAVELERLIVRLVGDATAYLQMLKQAHTQTRQFANAMRYDFARLQAAVAVPLALIGKKVVDEFSKFDKAMTESTAIMDVTDDVARKMADTALKLSTKAVQGPTELAKGFYSLASAGMTAEQAMKALPVVSKFATAGAMDLASAIDHLSGAQSALGMRRVDPTENMQAMAKLADILVGANNKALGTTKQFAEALSNDAAAAMRVFGIEVEDGVAALMAMAEQGNMGQKAGGDLARMLRLLSAAAVKNSKEFEKLGVSFFDADGNTKSLVDIIKSLETVLTDASSESKAMALNMLGIQARSQNAIFPLIGMSKRMEQFREELRKTQGITETVAQKQLKAFANQMQITWNTVTVLAIEIGSILAPAILMLGQYIRDAVKWFQSLSPVTKQIIVHLTALVGIITGVAATVALFGFLFGSVASGVAEIAAVILVLAGALAFIEQQTGAVTSAWEYLKKAGVKTWKYLVGIFNTLAREMEPIIEAVTELANELWKEFRAFAGELQVLLEDLWNEVGKDALEAWNWLHPVRQAVFDFIATMVRNFGRGFVAFVKIVFDSVKGMVLLIHEFYKFVKVTMGLIEMVTGVTWDDIRNAVVRTMAVAEFSFANFGKVASITWSVISLGFKNMVREWIHFFTKTLPYMVAYFKDVFVAVFDGLYDYFKNFLKNLTAFIVALPTNIPKLIEQGATGEKLAKALTDAFSLVVPELKINLPKLELPKRVVDPKEVEEMENLNKEAEELNKNFDEFLKKKLERFGKRILKHPADLPPGEVMDDEGWPKWFEDFGKKMGKGFTDGFGREMDKFTPPARWEAVLFDSVESLIRQEESMIRQFGIDWRKFQEVVNEGPGGFGKNPLDIPGLPKIRPDVFPRDEMPARPPILPPVPRPPAVPAQPANPMNPVPVNNPAPRRDIQSERTVELLEEIRDELRILNKKPALPVGGGLR